MGTTQHDPDLRPGGWGNRDFHDEVPRRRRVLERGWASAAVCVFAFLVLMFAISHENQDCGDRCFDGDGILPYEPGHAWTAYQESWQWQAQWLMAVGAMVLAVAALAASSRYAWRRWTLACNVGAVVLALGWIAWVGLEPPLPA